MANEKQSTKNFDRISEIITSFSIESFKDEDKVKEYIYYFKINEICNIYNEDKSNCCDKGSGKSKTGRQGTPYPPQYNDLCRLHWIILKRKVVNVLELGSGYSTAVMADAMRILFDHFWEWAKDNIRAEKHFHVFSVEESREFANTTNAIIQGKLSIFASVLRSSVEMVLVDNRITTMYSKLPNISPDLIYVDGPSRYATTQEINGFTFGNIARMPMSSDILRFEFFLEPGTLVLLDGRTANARFLKAYLKRNWAYSYDPEGDIHLFELQEPPLGRYNKIKLDFCLGNKWMLA